MDPVVNDSPQPRRDTPIPPDSRRDIETNGNGNVKGEKTRVKREREPADEGARKRPKAFGSAFIDVTNDSDEDN